MKPLAVFSPARLPRAIPPTRSLLLRSRSDSAFTVMELLVTVAIIAAVIALAFNALPVALEASRASKCAGNLRALGQSFFAYLGDHGQRFPAGYAAPGGWPQELVNGQYATLPSFCCPSNRENPDVYHGTWSHFGYNYAHLATQIRQTGDTTNRVPALFSQIVAPSMTVLLVENLRPDRSKSSYLVWDAYSTNSTEYGNPEPRHRGGFNILWCDGHVSRMTSPTPQAAYNPENLGSYKSATSKWKIR